jgi:hypothetical protein
MKHKVLHYEIFSIILLLPLSWNQTFSFAFDLNVATIREFSGFTDNDRCKDL